MTLRTAITLTIFGGILTSISWIFQKQAAVELPKVSPRLPGEVLIAFGTSRKWLLGAGMMGLGFGCFQIAVAMTGEISILQPIFCAGGALLAVLAVVFLHERFTPLEWLALVLLVLAGPILALTAEAHATHLAPIGLMLTTALGVVVVALGLWGAGSLSRFLGLEFVLGVGGGLIQGVGLISMGAYSYYSGAGAPWSLLLVLFAVTCFLASFISMQRGVQEGRAMVVVTLNAVVTNVMAIAGGILVLGETLPEGPHLAALQMAAFAAIVAGSGVLGSVSVRAGRT
jgi:drug/metabolite transporter (DMT)-like permease